jgi:hypothetical protein
VTVFLIQVSSLLILPINRKIVINTVKINVYVDYLTIEAREIGQKSHIIYNKFNILPLWYRLCLTLNQVQGLFF